MHRTLTVKEGNKDRKKTTTSRNEWNKDTVCYTCGEKGHIARNCRTGNARSAMRENSWSNGNNNRWVGGDSLTRKVVSALTNSARRNGVTLRMNVEMKMRTTSA